MLPEVAALQGGRDLFLAVICNGLVLREEVSVLGRSFQIESHSDVEVLELKDVVHDHKVFLIHFAIGVFPDDLM